MISLIIPIYNSEKYLNKLLDSILSQKFNDYEIIIVDDGSIDSSKSLIKNYSIKTNKIKYIYQKNKGPGLARKNGFKNSKGDLIFFIDSDDFLPNKNALYEINKIFTENKDIDILFFNFIKNENGKDENINAFRDSKLKEGLNKIKYINNHPMGGALWNKIFKREIMQEDFFIDANNFEDYYTIYSYLNKCKNFYYTRQVYYYTYRDNKDSLTKKNDIDKMLKTVQTCKKISELPKFKKMTQRLFLNSVFNCLNYILKNFDKEKYSFFINKLNSLITLKEYKIKYIGIKGMIKKIIINFAFIYYKK